VLTAVGVDLRIVPSASVRPHEVADPGREQRIEARLAREGQLRDPLMVGAVPDVDGYVLLDGTNRQRALDSLGYPLLMVQVLDYANAHAVQLKTWCHSADLPTGELSRLAGDIQAVDVLELSPLEAPDAMRDPTTLAALLGEHGRFLLSRTDSHASRADQLRQLVGLYQPRLRREDCDLDEVEERAAALSRNEGRTLIAFPAFSRFQVVSMAMHGAPIPAGITRHVIGTGRALRVNLPLEVLASGISLEAANQALEDHVSALHPRVYREPTILFDS
jgi:hypothetical protein